MTEDPIIAAAKAIAIIQGYPTVNGLQLVDDYVSSGRQCLGLQSKYNQEWIDLQHVFDLKQSGQKTKWQLLRKAMNIYYYCRQLEVQTGKSLWKSAGRKLQGYGLRLPDIIAVANDIYHERSLGKDRKDEPYELERIQQIIAQRPKSAGATQKYDNLTSRLDLRIPLDVKKTLQYASAEMEKSINETIVQFLRESESFMVYSQYREHHTETDE